jgi:hypothetical protein
LPLSVVTLTSQPLVGLPSQSAKPVAQASSTQVPDEHVAAALAKRHTTPQPPQLLTSVLRTARSQPLDGAPSQSAKPALQPPTTQRLPTHALTLALAREQRVPHAPQLPGSVVVLTQSPEQLVVPAPQLAPHTSLEHTCPDAQAIAHRPQLLLSVRMLASQPSDGDALQSAKPGLHVPIEHVPDAHVAMALAKRHTMLHPPQLLVSVPRTLVSQPLAGTPSQSAKPAVQPPTTQRPATQAFTLVLARLHTVPQAPQLAGATSRLTQAPEQVVVPAPQVVPQRPDEHT